MDYSYKVYYKRIWLLILIPVVGLSIAAIFTNAEFNELNIKPVIIVLHSIIITGGLWLGCMTIVNLLWKHFPWEKQPVKHLILEIVFLLAFTNLFSYGLYIFEVKLKLVEPLDKIFTTAIITNLITLFITSIHEAIAFYKQWTYNFSKSVKLEKDNIEAKYETLKTQINPHFLFNSLNSLTNLVEENGPAVDYIQNLSEFLRYILKSRDRELVLLRDEISILEKYLKLQKIRFKDNLVINMDVTDSFWHYAVPPLVIQMLVENCIKHNIISRENPLHINIHAEKEYLSVENNLQKKNNSESTGNGLQNIVERYRFFTRNEVKITETNTTFKVTIPLLVTDI